jgi:hypothetical protein
LILNTHQTKMAPKTTKIVQLEMARTISLYKMATLMLPTIGHQNRMEAGRRQRLQAKCLIVRLVEPPSKKVG